MSKGMNPVTGVARGVQSTEGGPRLMAGTSFAVDVAAIRDHARQKMDQGPVTEIVCWMRYSRHAISAAGIDRAQVSGEFTEHADEERQHAMWAADRNSQLGGDPDFDPTTRRLMEKILQEEEEHADDIVNLLAK
jgi:bacterioferritin (cytochrome b1)